MHQESCCRVVFEQIVHPGDDSHDGCWRSVKREASKPLDEAGDKGGGKMRGGKEGIQQPEESRAMLGVQQVCVEERVQFQVEGRVIQVLLADEEEETREGEEGSRPAVVVSVCEEVHEEFGAGEPGLDVVGHDAEEGFALVVGEGWAAQDGEPGVLGALFVGDCRG